MNGKKRNNEDEVISLHHTPTLWMGLKRSSVKEKKAQSVLKDQTITNLNFSVCDISGLFDWCHLCFIHPVELIVSSSSGVQMEHQGLFTQSVCVRCLVRSSQGGILSIRVIYERPYWAYYAWTKTGSVLLGIEGHLRVDYMKKNWKLHKYSLEYQM